MPTTFAEKLTAVPPEVSQQSFALHLAAPRSSERDHRFLEARAGRLAGLTAVEVERLL
jgi:hypothetical protein